MTTNFICDGCEEVLVNGVYRGYILRATDGYFPYVGVDGAEKRGAKVASRAAALAAVVGRA